MLRHPECDAGTALFIYWQVWAVGHGGRYPAGVFSGYAAGIGILGAQAILVRDGSPLRNLADLKGKKVAVTKAAGAHYLLYSRFAGADDRIGTVVEWEDEEALDRLGVDSGVIQLMLIETGTRYLVDTARIHIRGGILTFYDNQPADQLRAPFEQYARTLLGVSER